MKTKKAIIVMSVMLFTAMSGVAALAETIAPTVSKTAEPADINIAGTGVNEETTVTLTVAGAGDEWTRTLPMDVVFALDSSGSMGWNDPTGQRKTAAKDFVDKMDPTRDQAGVVSWDGGINFTQPLTSNFALAKSRIGAVDSYGGTNLNVGLTSAMGLLDSGKQPDSLRVIIFLTDGAGSYSHSVALAAAAKGYVIYSIGLGSVNTAPLTDMANTTGGKYFASPSADNLQAIFDDIFTEIVLSTIPHYVDVVEVVQDHMTVVGGSFNIAPDSVIVSMVDGTTTIIWKNVGMINDGHADLSGDETASLSFRATCDLSGRDLEVDVFGAAKVNYCDRDGNPAGSVDIPQAYINVNALPNVAGAYPNPDCLWPANHKFFDVGIEGVTDPDGDPVTIEIVGITSDEATASEKGAGGPKHNPDAEGIGADKARLKAESSGNSNGRVYEVRFAASDGKGGETEGSVFVSVPHDQNNACDCVDDGQMYDATVTN